MLWAVSIAVALFSFLIPFVFGVSFTNTGQFREFFDVNGERNLPAWWNAGLLLLAGILAAAIGTARRICRADTVLALLAWWGLAAVLAAMSLDEFAGVHERLDVVWARLVGENPLPAFQWLMLGVPLAVAVLAFLWLCVSVLPRAAARTYLVGMVVVFTGAIVVEALPLLFDIWRGTLSYHLTYHVEELLEFVGAALLVIAPLRAVRARVVDASAGSTDRPRRPHDGPGGPHDGPGGPGGPMGGPMGGPTDGSAVLWEHVPRHELCASRSGAGHRAADEATYPESGQTQPSANQPSPNQP